MNQNQNSSIALYARVSSDKQVQEGTIESQVSSLREYMKANHYPIQEDLVFIDNGVSGSSLVRPSLEKLRDKAFNGEIDRIVVLCPDRLSRKYSHQLILVEEFQRLGVEIVFVNRSLSDSPEDQLLFQIQGVIAEFEREKIMERSRRGKLHKAKLGKTSVLSNAAYGYIYKHTRNGVDARWEIYEKEAEIVRKIFHMYTQEQMSMWKITNWLNANLIPTRRGLSSWSRSTVGQMLRNPAYAGKAAYQKTRGAQRVKRIQGPNRSRYPKSINSSRRQRDKSEWLTIPVPPIVDQIMFDRAAVRSEYNLKFSIRNTKRSDYLGSGLLACKGCGYSLVVSANSRFPNSRYYRCNGTRPHEHHGKKLCESKPIRTEIIDELLWLQTMELIQHPEEVLKEYANRYSGDSKKESEYQMLLAKKKKELNQKQVEKERVLDLYQSSVIEKEELEERISAIRAKIKTIEQEQILLEQERRQQEEGLKLVENFEKFAEKIGKNILDLSFQKKQEIVRLLVNEVVVDSRNHQIEVRHIMPLDSTPILCPSSP